MSTALAASGATLDWVHADSHESDERALARRAPTDADAFAELYRRYLPRIHEFAFRRTGSVEAAEDICAATFESALKTIGRFRWGNGGFAPWIYRIAARQVITHYRRESRSTSERGQRAAASLSPTTTPGADDQIEALGADVVELRRALGELNDRYQRAISLRYLADLDTAEAAKAMGLARPAYSVVLTRAVGALRRELERGDT